MARADTNAVAEPVAAASPVDVAMAQGEAAPLATAPISEQGSSASVGQPSGDAGGGNTEYALGALLAALAAGGLGGLMLTGRRRRERTGQSRENRRAAVKPPVLFAHSPRAGTSLPPGYQGAGKPAPAAPTPGTQGVVTSKIPAPAGQPVAASTTVSANLPGGLSHSGAAVALPPVLPGTVEERRALLERLAAARPDRANPFRTPKARRHRARLIMQCIGRRFESGKSRIDFSQYPLNWPELAQNRNAAA